MKIAIYGGSFNPPHLGHYAAACAVVDAVHPDKLLIMPANLPPHKLLAPNSPSPAERLTMCRLAFAGIPCAEVSDLELSRGGLSYTSDTVSQLRNTCPGDTLFLVVGTDMLLSFTSWHEFEYILSECTLLVLTRDYGEDAQLSEAAEHLRRQYHASVRVIPCAPVPAASTEIRQELSQGRRPQQLSENVYQYILSHHYYSL